MAILKKRTSSKQLPEAGGLDRNLLSSVIRDAGDGPSISGGRPSSIPSSGGSSTITPSGSALPPSTSTSKPVFTSGSTAKPSITSTTKPITTKPSITTKPAVTTKTTTTKPTITTPTTTKPSITTKTPTTPTTKTTTPTSVVKPVVTPPKTNTNSTSNKVVNALTGAAIGAGTKFLVDKITGKPTVAPKAPAGTTVPQAPSKVPSAPSGGPKPSNAPADKKKDPTSVVKTPAGGGSLVTADVAYKGTLADESLGLPSGAIDNGDGTYTVGNTTYSMDNDSVLYTTDASGAITVAGDAKLSDEETALAQEEGLSAGESIEYANGTTITALDNGNGGVMYVRGGYDTETGLGPKGGGTRSLGGTNTAATDGDTVVGDDTVVAGDDAEPELFEDRDGNQYTMNSDGTYDLAYYADGSSASEDTPIYDFGDDTAVAENTDSEIYDFGDDTLLAENTDPEIYDYGDSYEYAGDDYGGDDYAKRGGLITMMKNGGVPKFEDGGYVDNGDGTYSVDNYVYDMETDDYLYTIDSDGGVSNINPDYISSTDDVDYVEPAARSLTPSSVKNVGSGAINTKKDNYETDAQGNVFKNGVFYRAPEIGEGPENALSSDFLKTITDALGTTAGAAGAGALVASLLGGDFGGGGTGAQNQGVDMSQVGVINPRTTDFGIGPTNFVGYDQYGTDSDDYTPNEELLRNLNAPGYNPVNEGDYGYEEVPAEEGVPAMSSGGLSSMSTPVASYYTFGQPADILANLGMRPQPPMNPPEMMPQMGQQNPSMQSMQQSPQPTTPQQMLPQMGQQASQGMPQQGMPQQGMTPQGMPQQMRMGGLPHVSNVPMTQGRMDFRKGAAVHGAGDGQSDDIPAMLADGEYVIDAETVAQIGNGSTKAGAQALDKFREGIRAHKRSAPLNKIPPKTKPLTSYLKGAK
jgi:hypothetical protein